MLPDNVFCDKYKKALEISSEHAVCSRQLKKTELCTIWQSYLSPTPLLKERGFESSFKPFTSRGRVGMGYSAE
jgi:hypothetical protein